MCQTDEPRVVMHRYHFLATYPILMLFKQRMADTNSIPILWYTDVIHKNSNQFNIISFLNEFANLFTIIETETLIAGFP